MTNTFNQVIEPNKAPTTGTEEQKCVRGSAYYDSVNCLYCSICHRFFKSNINRHMRTHSVTDQRPYVCTVCNNAYKQKEYLTFHEKKHTMHTCQICNTSFTTERRLHYHLAIHTKTKNKPYNVRLHGHGQWRPWE